MQRQRASGAAPSACRGVLLTGWGPAKSAGRTPAWVCMFRKLARRALRVDDGVVPASERGSPNGDNSLAARRAQMPVLGDPVARAQRTRPSPMDGTLGSRPSTHPRSPSKAVFAPGGGRLVPTLVLRIVNRQHGAMGCGGMIPHADEVLVVCRHEDDPATVRCSGASASARFVVPPSPVGVLRIDHLTQPGRVRAGLAVNDGLD